MAQINTSQVVPELLNLAKTERDKKRKKAVEDIAETVDAVLTEAEEVREATRNVANVTLQQREALHALIKEYAKLIDDADERNNMLREAGRIVRGQQ